MEESELDQKTISQAACDAAVLGLAPVNGLHVQGVAEDEGDPLLGAEVGDPVPGEDALDGHHEILPVRGDGGEKVLRGRGAITVDAHRAVPVQDADVHPSRMQVDPTVVSVLLGIEPHPGSSFPQSGCCLATITLP